MLDQSRLQAAWSAGGHQGRLWGTGIFTAEILRLTVLSFVTANSQSKDLHDHPMTRKPDDSEKEIECWTRMFDV